MFIRQDWTLFRTLGTLCQKAGVPITKLRRLVLKELMDNALDNDPSGSVEHGKEGGTYWVSNGGPPIPGTPEQIASLFSIGRPLTSSKVIRLPARGALGNGLRVVAGAVLASSGTLRVATGDHELQLQPLDDGSTKILAVGPNPYPDRTRVSVTFGQGVPEDVNDQWWAMAARQFRLAKSYQGKTNAWWYDSDSFYELFKAAGQLPLHSLLGQFAGVKPDPVKGAVSPDAIWPDCSCEDLSRDQAHEILGKLRQHRNIKPDLLGGAGQFLARAGYGKINGYLEVAPGRSGGTSAQIPFVIEVWATACHGNRDDLDGYVNGTPVTGDLRGERQKGNKLAIFGCGLSHYVGNLPKKNLRLQINVITPFMPVTTDGKEPDLARLRAPMEKAIMGAVRRFKRVERANVGTQGSVVLANLDKAVAKASGNGRYRYSLRQLYYAIRPYVLESDLDNKTIGYNHFAVLIGKYESSNTDLKGLYRDPRGTLYHPHLRRSIPIGTLAVENYERPAWTFNKILYIEKESFVNMLIADGWPERHDCALLTSKGFASRAVRDLLDLLGDTGEEIQFFCVHDADASGSLIYQSLQEGTPARARRRVKILNFGLEPWEGLEMGLQVEDFDIKGNRKLPVADYVRWSKEDLPEDFSDDEDGWAGWLQGRRVELNAMTSDQFMTWLNEKMLAHATGKVIPPREVLAQRLSQDLACAVRSELAQVILAQADLEGQVQQALLHIPKRPDAQLIDQVKEELVQTPDVNWAVVLERMARKEVANYNGILHE